MKKKILLTLTIISLIVVVFALSVSASDYFDYDAMNFCNGMISYEYYDNHYNGFDSSVNDTFGVFKLACSECVMYSYGFVNIEWWHSYFTEQNVSNYDDYFAALSNLFEIGAIESGSGIEYACLSDAEFFYNTYEKYVAELNALSYDDGVSDGTELGYISGYSQGEAAGLKAGYEEGFADYKLSTEYLLKLEQKYNEGYYDREAESFVSIDYSFITMAVPLLCVLGAVVIILAVVKRSKKR